MQSPITGKEMSLKSEVRKLDFRKESFDDALEGNSKEKLIRKIEILIDEQNAFFIVVVFF